MIEVLENKIYRVVEKDFVNQFDLLIKALEKKEPGDLIIVFPTLIPTFLKNLDRLISYQKKQNRLLVWVLHSETSNQIPAEWTCVPTLQEAIDYIQFEQMQRDLGF
mgnify:CR=1 FL=1